MSASRRKCTGIIAFSEKSAGSLPARGIRPTKNSVLSADGPQIIVLARTFTGRWDQPGGRSMRRTSVVRFLTSVVIASFVVAGPLAPLTQAQQPAPSAEVVQAQPVPQAQPPVPAQPVPQAQPPVQPDLFQEKLKAERTSDRSQAAYNVQAAVVNVFYVPGKAITCAAGGALGIIILAVSFGTGYRNASFFFEEGCGGKWVVKGDDLRPDTPPTLVT